MRQAGRQNRRFFFGIVVVRNKVNRVFANVGEHFAGKLLKLDFGVTHGRGRVTVKTTEVTLTVNQRIAKRERLSQTNNRIVGGCITMRVIFTDHITNHTGGFLCGTRIGVTHLLHRVKHATMNGFQTVPNVRQSAAHNHAHCVIQISTLHFGFQRNR